MASPGFSQAKNLNCVIYLFIYVFIATPSFIRSRMLTGLILKAFILPISIIHLLICILSFFFPYSFLFYVCMYLFALLGTLRLISLRPARNLFANACPLPKLEADHSPQSRGEVKNSWNYTSLPHISS
jgi:hypothetical protein